MVVAPSHKAAAQLLGLSPYELATYGMDAEEADQAIALRAMATSEQKVKAVHPRAAKKRYSKTGGGSYFLVWSGFPGGRERACAPAVETRAPVDR